MQSPEIKTKTANSVTSRTMQNYVQRIRDLKLYPLNLGMICSGNFQSTQHIIQFFIKIKDLPNYVTILGGGSGYVGDTTVKKIALELELGYREYNPVHTPYNVYSAFPQYRYSKAFNTGNFMTRYNELVKKSDKLIIFQDKDCSDIFINKIITQLEKQKILVPYVILNE